MNVEFIFSEFGLRTTANQPGGFTDEFRLDPTYSSVKQFFPDAKLTLYTDRPELATNYSDVEVKLVDIDNSPFTKSNHRWGWHCCDYYEAKGLLNSDADIAISVDSDLMFVSDEVKTLLPITDKFGLCVPTNERQMVKVDGIHTRGNDGDYYIDEDGDVIRLSDERVPMIGAKSVYGVENQTDELNIQADQSSGMTVEEADRWVQGQQ